MTNFIEYQKSASEIFIRFKIGANMALLRKITNKVSTIISELKRDKLM